MLEEAIIEWREAAVAEGLAQGIANERALLRRIAARRFGVAAGDALATLLMKEEGAERLATIGDLIVDAASGEELLGRSRSVMAHGSGGSPTQHTPYCALRPIGQPSAGARMPSAALARPAHQIRE